MPDRVPIYDSYWGATIERWRREGLPHDVSPADYFEHDIVRIGGDDSMQFSVRLLEEGEDPDLVHEMVAAQTQLDIYEGMKRRGMTFDAAWFNDDLGYNKTSLISPQMYRELVFPYHKRLCDYMANEGLKTLLHSDGNLLGLIPHFLDAGFVGLHPLEAKASLDVRDLKPQYGKRLILFGNVDMRAMAAGGATLEEEIISKILFAKEGGGYLYHSDHSVPDNVSFAHDCRVMELVQRYGTYG